MSAQTTLTLKFADTLLCCHGFITTEIIKDMHEYINAYTKEDFKILLGTLRNEDVADVADAGRRLGNYLLIDQTKEEEDTENTEILDNLFEQAIDSIDANWSISRLMNADKEELPSKLSITKTGSELDNNPFLLIAALKLIEEALKDSFEKSYIQFDETKLTELALKVISDTSSNHTILLNVKNNELVFSTPKHDMGE